MIRGAIYRVSLGETKRGHELRGRRYGLVVSLTDLPWSMVTIIPISSSAQPAIFRPEIEFNDTATRLLVDQIRSVDTIYVIGDPVYYLTRTELEQVEFALARYLGL